MMVNQDIRNKLKQNQKFSKNIYCLDLSCFACLYLKLADLKFRPKMPCLSDRTGLDTAEVVVCREMKMDGSTHPMCLNPSAEERRYPHLVSLSPSELQPNSNDD